MLEEKFDFLNVAGKYIYILGKYHHFHVFLVALQEDLKIPLLSPYSRIEAALIKQHQCCGVKYCSATKEESFPLPEQGILLTS